MPWLVQPGRNGIYDSLKAAVGNGLRELVLELLLWATDLIKTIEGFCEASEFEGLEVT